MHLDICCPRELLILSGTSTVQTNTNNFIAPAPNPAYMVFLDNINDDPFGIGIGIDTLQLDNVTITFQNTLLGLPFVTLIGIIISFICFQQARMEIGIIVHITIIGFLTISNIINIPTAILGLIITIGIIALLQYIRPM